MNLKHQVIEIMPRTWCISEFQLVNAFLVEGDEYAALIDTGCGIGNIGEAAQKITNKPIKILLTHAHMDHNGGIYTLPNAKVYMHPQDEALLQKTEKNFGKSLNEMRKKYVETRVPVRFPGEGHVEALLKLIPDSETDNQYQWEAVQDAQEIELGNRTLHVIHTPGHTDGSVCYLDKKSRILFSGDTANQEIILMRQPDNNMNLVKQYHDTMKRLWQESEYYDSLAIGHGENLLENSIIKDYLDLTERLLTGEILGQYEEKDFRKGDVARFGNAVLWYQCDE